MICHNILFVFGALGMKCSALRSKFPSPNIFHFGKNLKDSIVDYCGFCVSREVAITTEKMTKIKTKPECWLVGATNRSASLSMIVVSGFIDAILYPTR